MTSIAMRETSGSPLERLRHNIGLFLPMILVGGVAAVALVYYFGMLSLGWTDRSRVGLPAVFAGAGTEAVVIYAPRSTARYMAASEASYEKLIAPWRSYLRAQRISFREYSEPKQLEAVSGGVLILPSAVALDARERELIRNHLNRGGSVLASWATGARDGDGNWLGYDYVEKLFGIQVRGEVSPDGDESFLMPAGESPLNLRLPAGQRLWMGKVAEKPLRLEAPRVAARYLNWMRARRPGMASGAVAYGELDANGRRGRWAMMGFAESSWEQIPPDYNMMLDDLFAWLQRKPAVALANWPHPYRAANLIEMDTEHLFRNATRFANDMARAGFTATFYSLTSEAVKHPMVVHQLSQRHEIAYHAEIHVGFKGESEEKQSARLDRMIADMHSLLGNNTTSRVTGFRAPTEGYDAITEKLLALKGLRHHAADPASTESRVPFVSKHGPQTPGEALIVLPRAQRDDINFIEAGFTSEQIANGLIDDFDLARETAGLSLISIHTQLYEPGSHMSLAVPRLIAHAARHRKEVWTASGTEIADWWRDRLRVNVKWTLNKVRQIELQVTVTGPREVRRVALLVMNPVADLLPGVRAQKVGNPLPRVEKVDALRSALVFDVLKPGHYSYLISY